MPAEEVRQAGHTAQQSVVADTVVTLGAVFIVTLHMLVMISSDLSHIFLHS